jgi:hypothetical protein
MIAGETAVVMTLIAVLQTPDNDRNFSGADIRAVFGEWG